MAVGIKVRFNDNESTINSLDELELINITLAGFLVDAGV
jgi:hypothetical protein